MIQIGGNVAKFPILQGVIIKKPQIKFTGCLRVILGNLQLHDSRARKKILFPNKFFKVFGNYIVSTNMLFRCVADSGIINELMLDVLFGTWQHSHQFDQT